MSRLCAPYLLAGLAVAAAFLLGAVCDWGQLSAVFMALGPGDALIGVLGLVLAAMTGATGVLIAADGRADVDAAHAWQDISAELAVVGTVTEAAPVHRIDERYIASPQDEGLRRILLAHRFIVRVPSHSDAGSPAPPSADAVAAGGIEGVRSGTELVITDQLPTADHQPERMAEPRDAAIDWQPLPTAGNVKDYRGRSQRSTKRRVSRAPLVANAGVWWSGPVRMAVDVRRVLAGGCAADVIVLADRNSGDRQPAHRDLSPVPATTAQPGCRGPPVGVSQQTVTSGPVPVGKSFRERDRPRGDPPADPVVIDNLGDCVPVGAAELEVVDTYLDDVLGILLATVASDQDHRES